MQRRLQVAICLVGDPSVVFLDEPTTGLDPTSRRHLWTIISRARKHRSIVLTTHSMHEAEVLCTRIGIFVDGALRCLGEQTHLKNKFGGGYHLHINHRPENGDQARGYVAKAIPSAKLVSRFPGSATYLVDVKGIRVSNIFVTFERDKDQHGITDWGIGQTTLEDVFIRVVERFPASDMARFA
eukprot:TRINITY_DN1758_c0_g1_i1.p2 TRINITY_DN1758_c0_g1~~TRINITY_DN1758_c0_g1_i1.p2  ORF type:complete len:183 (-),score=39.10 TRINITY_DN1758_c0_g1_i1:91-639(-)